MGKKRIGLKCIFLSTVKSLYSKKSFNTRQETRKWFSKKRVSKPTELGRRKTALINEAIFGVVEP